VRGWGDWPHGFNESPDSSPRKEAGRGEYPYDARPALARYSAAILRLSDKARSFGSRCILPSFMIIEK